MARFAVEILMLPKGHPEALAALKSLGPAAQGSASGVRNLAHEILGVEVSLKGLGALAARAFAGLGVAQAALGIGRIAGEYEQLRLQLETVIGSAQGAAQAFKEIQAFAQKTPFEVSNITTAFIRLSAVGLNPTLDLLTSLGNTAAAFGKDITEFAQAVIGATTGEMEMLKSFGIVARQQGDVVKFTFKGVTTEVARESAAIAAYLKQIGDTHFAGGMERQAASMNGAISNVKDAWAALADTIGKSGLTDAVAGLARALAVLLGWLGQHPAVLKAVTTGLLTLGAALLVNKVLASAAAFNVLMTALSLLIAPVQALQLAWARLNATMLANPYVAVAVAAAVVGTALYNLRDANREAQKAQEELNKALGTGEKHLEDLEKGYIASSGAALQAALAYRKALAAELERASASFLSVSLEQLKEGGLTSDLGGRITQAMAERKRALAEVRDEIRRNEEAIWKLQNAEKAHAAQSAESNAFWDRLIAMISENASLREKSQKKAAEVAKKAEAEAKRLQQAIDSTRASITRNREESERLIEAARKGPAAYAAAAKAIEAENLATQSGIPLDVARRTGLLGLAEAYLEVAESAKKAEAEALKALVPRELAPVGRLDPFRFGTIPIGIAIDQESLRAQIRELGKSISDPKVRELFTVALGVEFDPQALQALLANLQEVLDAQAEGAEEFRTQVEEAEAAMAGFLQQRAADLRAVWTDLGVYMRDSILDNLAAAAAGADVHWKDMWQSFIQTAAQALSDWLVLYLTTLAKAKAAENALGTGTPGGGGSGGWISFLRKLYGGGGGGGYSWLYGAGSANTGSIGADAGILDSASGGAGAGAGGGGFLSGGAGAVSSGSYAYGSYGGALAAMAAWVAVIAALVHQIKTEGRAEVDTSLRFGGGQGIGIDEDLSRYNRQGGLARYKAQMKAMQEMVKAVVAFIQGLGGEIDKFSADTSSLTLGREGQGKQTNWFVRYADGLVKHFGKDMQAAMDFAMVQAIKQAPTVGLSPEIAQAIQVSTAESMQQLERDIETAKSVLRARLGDVGFELTEIFRRWGEEIRRAEALGLAIDGLIAARDREIGAVRYQYLGISTATSDFLADLVSYQAGIGEVANSMRAQIENQIASAQRELDALRSAGPRVIDLPSGATRVQTNEQWEREIAKLEEQVARYIAELEKIPKALTDQELSMSIFDALYKYLEGSAKYAKEAHKYALIRVEIEFALIEAQLKALGKWEEFETMFNDAFRAAREAAGRGGRGRGSGGNRQEAQRTALDQLASMRAAAMGEVATAVYNYTVALRDWNAAAKEGKLTAEQRAEGERLLRAEMQRTLRQRAQDLAGMGTDLTRALEDGMRFFDDLRAQGRGATGMPNWMVDLLEGKFLDRMGLQFQQALNEFQGFTDSFLAIEIQADILRQGLRAMAEAAGWSAERIAEAEAAIAAGEEYQREKAVLGVFSQIYEYLKDSPAYAGQILELKKRELELQFKIIEAQLRAFGVWDAATQKLVADARAAGETALRIPVTSAKGSNVFQGYEDAAVSSTTALQDLAKAAADASATFFDVARDIAASNRELLTDSSRSALSPQAQRAAALAAYEETLAKARAGDINALKNYTGVRTTLLDIERGFSKSGGAYAELFERVMREGAGLILDADVERATVERLLAEQNATATQSAAQLHADLLGLRASVVDGLNALAVQLGQTPNLLNGIPQFAQGGVARGPSLAGEAGPEAIVPLPNGKSIPVQVYGPSPQADNSEVTKELRTGNAVTARGHDRTARILEKIEAGLAEQNRRLAALENAAQRGANFRESEEKRRGRKAS